MLYLLIIICVLDIYCKICFAACLNNLRNEDLDRLLTDQTPIDFLFEYFL